MASKSKAQKSKKRLLALPPINLQRITLTVKVMQQDQTVGNFNVILEQAGGNTVWKPGTDNIAVIPLEALTTPVPATNPPTQISNAQFGIVVTSTTGLFSTNVNFVSGISANTDVVIVLQP